MRVRRRRPTGFYDYQDRVLSDVRERAREAPSEPAPPDPLADAVKALLAALMRDQPDRGPASRLRWLDVARRQAQALHDEGLLPDGAPQARQAALRHVVDRLQSLGAPATFVDEVACLAETGEWPGP